MLEYKFAADGVQRLAENESNGVPVGIVEGYLATWQPDVQNGRYGKRDRFRKGAFAAALMEHKRRVTHLGEGRGVPLRDEHGRTCGTFPIKHLKEDSVGLWGRGEINLVSQQGRELYAMAQQGVKTDFSIGFQAVKDDRFGQFRDIITANIGEASLVDEPKNRGSRITEVKNMSPHSFVELDLAPNTYECKSAEARTRIDDLPFGQGNGSHAFLCGNTDFLIGDVIEGSLVAVPQLIREAVLEIKSLDTTPQVEELKTQLERYLSRMGEGAPFEGKHYVDLNEVKSWSVDDLEAHLVASGLFSKAAASHVVGIPETKTAALDDEAMQELEKRLSEWTSQA